MKSYFKKTAIIALLMLFALALAMPAIAAEYFKQKVVRFSATAGETLAAGDIVCIKGSDGEAYKADANDSNLRPAVGVIGKGGAGDTTVEIVAIGVLAGQPAASPGARLFLSETAATFTTTGPTNAQTLGWVLPGASATSSTNYFINVTVPSSGGAAY